MGFSLEQFADPDDASAELPDPSKDTDWPTCALVGVTWSTATGGWFVGGTTLWNMTRNRSLVRWKKTPGYFLPAATVGWMAVRLALPTATGEAAVWLLSHLTHK